MGGWVGESHGERYNVLGFDPLKTRLKVRFLLKLVQNNIILT